MAIIWSTFGSKYPIVSSLPIAIFASERSFCKCPSKLTEGTGGKDVGINALYPVGWVIYHPLLIENPYSSSLE